MQIDFEKLGQYCWLFDPEIAKEMFISNTIIFAAYYIIPIAIGIFLYCLWNLTNLKIRVTAFGFIAFILVCGNTHLVKVMNYFWRDFRLEANMDWTTAAISLSVAVFLLYASLKMLFNFIKNKEKFQKSAIPMLSFIGALKIMEHVSKKKPPITRDLFKNNLVDKIAVMSFDKHLSPITYNAPFKSDKSGNIVNTRINPELPGFNSTSVMKPNSYIPPHAHDTKKILKCTKGRFYDSNTKRWYKAGEYLIIHEYNPNHPTKNWHDIETGSQETELLTFIMPLT